MRVRLVAVAAALALVAFTAPSALADSAAETPGPGDISATRATAIARVDPKVAEQREKNGALTSSAVFKDEKWQVGWFADGDEVALVFVDPKSGEVLESWTGYQVAWEMARGYPGAFAHKFDAVWIFIPFCLFFLVGLFDWRHRRRLVNLDLLMLLGFVVSFYFFNRADIGVSVPLQYPPLVYLLGRCLWVGFRGRGPGLHPVFSARWLLIAALFLMGVRVGLNMADAGAIDVGYAGVVGADKIAHGEPIYDNLPDDIHSGDTYGPVNYLAYVPFERIWPWSGEWDDLPAAHGASVTFDVVAFALLILLGLRIRPGPEGRRLAAILAFGWASYPFTGYVLESDSNDTLIAALLIATLLVIARPFARGATLALATWAKFVPAVLAPMLLTYRPERDVPGTSSPPPPRPARGRLASAAKSHPAASFTIAFALVTVVALLWPAINPGLATMWNRSVGAQTGRSSPFSVWGQAEALEPLRIAILFATAALAALLAFRPRHKTLLQVAALSAATLIGVQLTLHHWFYLYIVWWFPLMLFALAAPREAEPPVPSDPEPETEAFEPEARVGVPA